MTKACRRPENQPPKNLDDQGLSNGWGTVTLLVLILAAIAAVGYMMFGCASAEKVVGLETELNALKGQVGDISSGQGSTTGLVALGGDVGPLVATGITTIVGYMAVVRPLRKTIAPKLFKKT